jgi:hypothetical protein
LILDDPFFEVAAQVRIGSGYLPARRTKDKSKTGAGLTFRSKGAILKLLRSEKRVKTSLSETRFFFLNSLFSKTQQSNWAKRIRQKINININIMEPKMETVGTEPCSTGTCASCAKAAEEASQNEELSMAFLLALVPVIALTFFGQIGLL